MSASSDTIVSSTRSRIPSCNSCKCSFELFTHVCRKYLIRGLTSLASIRSHYFPPLSPAHSCGTHCRGSWRVLLSSLSLSPTVKTALLTGRISSVSFCFCSSILLWVASAPTRSHADAMSDQRRSVLSKNAVLEMQSRRSWNRWLPKLKSDAVENGWKLKLPTSFPVM